MCVNLTLVALDCSTTVREAELLLDGYVHYYASAYPYSCEMCIGPSYLFIVENLDNKDKVFLSLQGHLIIELLNDALREIRVDVYNIPEETAVRVYEFFTEPHIC